MSSQLQFRRGSTVSNSTFVGADGEVTFDTDTNGLITHDGVTPGGFPGGGYLPPGAGAVPTSIQNKLRNTSVTPFDFGAVGDNSTDDYDAFVRAVTYCKISQTRLNIPEGMYVLGHKLVIDAVIDIVSDMTASMRWTNTADCGILLDFVTPDSLCSMAFPQLFSPVINAAFELPGYTPPSCTYDLSHRYGSAIEVRSGNRLNVSAHYIIGWVNGVLVTTATGSNSNNNNIKINTIDFCVQALNLTSVAGTIISGTVFEANTVWAKYPIYVDATVGDVVACNLKITGECYVNEPDGSTVYCVGANFNSSSVYVNWALSGWGSDSTTGVPSTLQTPFISGNKASNGFTTDGNATTGYFGGNFCDITIGVVCGIPGGLSAGSIPTAGHTIRIRDAGGYNSIHMLHVDRLIASPILLSPTQGETNYNGGVGGAQFSRFVYCYANVPILPPKNGYTAYGYHQLLSSINETAIKPVIKNSGTLAENIQVYASCAPSVNRQYSVEFINVSDTVPTVATTVYFFLEI